MHFRPKLAFMTPSGRLELEWEHVPIDDTGVDVSLNESVCEGRTTKLYELISDRFGNEASGLRWLNRGSRMPDGPTKMLDSKQYTALAAALREKQAFSKAERKTFGVQDLRTNHTIKVDGEYFQPINREMAKDSKGLRGLVRAAKSTSCLGIVAMVMNDA